MTCKNCGAGNIEAAKFCSGCGGLLASAEQESPEVPNDAQTVAAPEEKTLFSRFEEYHSGGNTSPLEFLEFQRNMKRAYRCYKLSQLLGMVALYGIFFILFEPIGWGNKLLSIFLLLVVICMPLSLISHFHKKWTGKESTEIDDEKNPYTALYGNKSQVFGIIGLVIGVLITLCYLSLGLGFGTALQHGILSSLGTVASLMFFWALGWWSLLGFMVLALLASML